ncbi:MAG: type I-MYXAN CRISPR-associated protein Cmx8, partial [Pseudanabaena sp. M114S2SP2A07QC]|nr:type I-MYXAN CRISPR-associated protein Cmx8 [Pseudanabaena sp. M114S2SP2A07QC]
DADDNQKDNYIIPEHNLSENGRILTVNLTEESFHSLMRERYRGIWLYREKGSKPKSQNTTCRLVNQTKLKNGKFACEEIRPLLDFYRIFEIEEAWQNHARDSTWSTFFCINRSRPIFQDYTSQGKVNKAIEIWKSLTKGKFIGVDKSIYPNAFKADLKSVEIEQKAKYAFLLHFWALVVTFFIPRGIKYEKSKITNKMELNDVYELPVVVIPEVVNTQIFVDRFINDLKQLPEATQTANGKPYLKDKFISIPVEASLYFFASRMAHFKSISPDIIGSQGVVVYAYTRTPTSQAIIKEITYDSIDESLVDEYKNLSKIKSFSYRSLRVQNLIDNRKWHEGFERLVARYPPDLFIAIKSDDTRRFDRRALQMVQSIYYDFQFYSNKEKGMKNVSIETLIWRIVRNYVEWRACERAKIPESERQKLRKEKGKHLKSKDYNKEVLDVTADLFINFRGRRDPTNFADAFCELFFRAPYYVSPEQMEQLRPFLSGDDWESGRRLVLMAISAAGALGNFNSSDNNDADSAEEDDVDFENDENSEDE